MKADGKQISGRNGWGLRAYDDANSKVQIP